MESLVRRFRKFIVTTSDNLIMLNSRTDIRKLLYLGAEYVGDQGGFQVFHLDEVSILVSY